MNDKGMMDKDNGKGMTKQDNGASCCPTKDCKTMTPMMKMNNTKKGGK